MRNQALSKTVIGITVVVIAITAGLYIYSKRDTVRPALSKQYVNNSYGISFYYPDTYNLTETSVETGTADMGTLVTLLPKGTRLPKNGEGPTAITVGMYDNTAVKDVKKSPVEAWIENSTSSNFQLPGTSKLGDTRVNGKSSLLYTWQGLYQGTSVVTEHRSNIIIFTVTYDGETDMEKRNDFAKIMETVQFVSATSSPTSTP